MQKNKKTTVELVTHTAFPVQAVYHAWLQSRTTMPVLTVQQMTLKANHDEDFRHKMMSEFEKIVEMKMPLLEMIDVQFALEHVPVALREQMVRHRIGHKFGETLGADIVPDMAGNSTYWSQTMRIIDCSNFFDNGEFYVPDVANEQQSDFYIKEQKNDWPDNVPEDSSSKNYYLQCLENIQSMYRHLVDKCGWAMEDARNVLPMALQHRITWKTNVAALLHVLSKRTCWHAQLGMWRPVIAGMIDALGKNIHPCFYKLLDPPCFDKAGEWSGCVFKPENEGLAATAERPNGGNNPPCSLWIQHHALVPIKKIDEQNEELPWNEKIERSVVGKKNWPRYLSQKEKYAELWVRDPLTGARRQVKA